MAWFEGAEIKARIIYFICVLLLVLGVLSIFTTPIIGFILLFGNVIIAVCGAAGAKFNSPRLLWYFMAGLAILCVLPIISIIYTVIKDGFTFWLIVNILTIVVYGAGIFLAFVLRGRSFRLNSAETGNFQKL
ncbi:hypothetical protein DICPUDRAFT_152090 [Dictyostelium purpureum]|uniref:Transmembrane protein n=1 Tax=Dictyostelium purpureum TaxID=5786 RepID=F0ZKG4_DICPU|nr:uncharacterized protein DICPUDRAFT_152090 [Dictyostelium purpureum]EGC35537.1 hypothetical protein DICPUDRAFT_152090 [Dictyostelium purpureum]|eukprot:XP_003287908.1 hypothetical protein DICPUDRAFT_152090 [Dictyostelium purpureum]